MTINWTVVYSAEAAVAELTPYSVVVLDSDSHPALTDLIDGSRDVLGYISLAEIGEYRPYYSEVEAQGILLGSNPNWPGAHYVDLRDSRWTARVLDQLIPSILDQGFTGLFLDTLDDAAYLEWLDPVANAGMTQAAADLVAAIRARYPTISIMMNRGYELLPQVADDIDYALAECLHSRWNGTAYGLLSNSDVEWQLTKVQDALALNPSLKAVGLDYWDPADLDGVARLYALCEAQGVSPYVSTISLNQVFAPPGDRAGDTIGAARALGAVGGTQLVADRVGGGDVDYYTFSLGASASLSWTLGTLSANADLAILSADGRLLAASALTGVTEDGISATLAAGTYVLKVSGAATAYVLDTAGSSATALDGVNTLSGGSGTDVLDGGAGADSLAGGAGDDTYIVDNSGDVITENADEGTDSVRSSATFTLAANVEVLTLTGSASINGTGNALANMLTGNSGANCLDGGSGADSLAGGAGNDTYVVDDAGDIVSESADDGSDTVLSSVAYTLSATLENLTLTGSADINGTGNAQANTLTGNAGVNSLIGGGGDDLYVVDSSFDVVREGLNAGTDTVRASDSYTLSANVENLTLSGSDDIDGVGNGLANVLTGNAGDNILLGGRGNDTLVGGAGDDDLLGSLGLDTVSYAGATAAVTVNLLDGVATDGSAGSDTLAGIENVVGSGRADMLCGGNGANVLDGGGSNDTLIGGGGDDTLIGGNGSDTASYATSTAAVSVSLLLGSAQNTLGAGTDLLSGIENLTGGGGNDTLTGNGVLNVLAGEGGNDTLIGSGGPDTLMGGAGNDRVVYQAGGLLDGGADSDTLVVGGASAVTVNLSLADQNGSVAGLVRYFENVDATAATGAMTLTGGSAANTLSGGGGNDTLTGGAGGDRLSGGAGADVFRYGATADGGDTIADFTSGQGDKLGFVSANFGRLAAGAITASMLAANSTGTAVGSASRFLFNTGNGVLKYDADGTGGIAAVTIATLNVRALAYTDIRILAS
ncbi:MAG TPA: endo alpha-1,4 polygalactosaminidase [Magnetospirillum sp.]|nr:endo alpha-1,4 polygalactosaminidase [Magnetospirillum sp.]